MAGVGPMHGRALSSVRCPVDASIACAVTPPCFWPLGPIQVGRPTNSESTTFWSSSLEANSQRSWESSVTHDGFGTSVTTCTCARPPVSGSMR